MRIQLRALGMTMFALSLAGLAFSQTGSSQKVRKLFVKPGFGFDYFSRTINWDEKKYTSKIKSYFITAGVEYAPIEKLSLTALAGYGSTNPNGMVFRHLPFSVDYEAGGISGFVLGAEAATKSLFPVGNFEIDIQARFVVYLGRTKTMDVTDLAVKGQLQGKATWSQFTVGPVVTYKGFNYFSPYVALGINKFWGSFKMDQTIQDLTGNEQKDFKGDGLFQLAVGAAYEFTDTISLKGEARLLPHKNGVDFGATATLTLTF